MLMVAVFHQPLHPDVAFRSVGHRPGMMFCTSTCHPYGTLRNVVFFFLPTLRSYGAKNTISLSIFATIFSISLSSRRG